GIIMTETALKDIDELLDKLAKALQAKLDSLAPAPCYLVGIHTGGVWLADYLHKQLALKKPLGKLDISFYRDDFEQRGLHPEVKPSTLDFNVDDAHIILVDDVVMSGRTIRAALNEIFDYGRPASVTLLSLIELDARELPIRPDI